MNNLIKKITCTLGLLLGMTTAVVVPVVSVVSCFAPPIEIHESADGFKYVMHGSEIDIVGFPNTEEVTIPTEINGYNVARLGHFTTDMSGRTITAEGSHIRKLNIQHDFATHKADFHLLEVIEIINPINWIWRGEDTIRIHYNVGLIGFGEGSHAPKFKKIIMSEKGEQILPVGITKIYIFCKLPNSNEFQYELQSGIFDGFSVVIGTDAREQQPTWLPEWNGNNKVVYDINNNAFEKGDW